MNETDEADRASAQEYWKQARQKQKLVIQVVISEAEAQALLRFINTRHDVESIWKVAADDREAEHMSIASHLLWRALARAVGALRR